MNETRPPLPSHLLDLLAAERARPGLSAEASERILTRLERSVGRAGERAGERAGDRATPRRNRRSTVGIFAAGLITGAALCAALLRPWTMPVQPQILRLDSPPPLPPRVIVVRDSVPLAVVPAPTHSAPLHRSDARSEPDRDTELARERALIETARTALSRKQPDAIDRLLQHETQFPNGRLAEERESLLVLALLQAGRMEEANLRADRFRARWPSSLLLPVLNAALRSIP